MKTLGAIVLFVVGLAFVGYAHATPGPENFTGTWKGTMTRIGSTKDVGMTFKVGCTDGNLTAEMDLDNPHLGVEARGEINEITLKGNEMTVLFTYRVKDPPTPGRGKTPVAGNKGRFTLKLAGEKLSGYIQNLNSGNQGYIALNRTDSMVACIITSASAR